MNNTNTFSDLPFLIEEVEDSNLVITPRLNGLTKREQYLIKKKGSSIRIITFNNELLEHLDSIDVDYPAENKSISLGKIIRCMFK